MINTIIFDFDGVICDSVPSHFKAWQDLFAGRGVLLTLDEYMEKLNGLPRNIGIKNIIPNIIPTDLEDLAKRKQEIFKQLILDKPPQVFDGVETLIKKLKKKKYKCAVASSSKNSKFILDQIGLSHYFDTIVTGFDFSRPKPDPDIFLTTCNILETDPENCLVFEDAPLGIKAAKNAGMKAIGIASTQPFSEFQDADLVFETITEIRLSDI